MSKHKAKTVDKIVDNQLITEKLSVSADLDNIRDRKFCLITYIDVNAVERLLRRSEWVQHWAYCSHNRDKFTDDVTINGVTHKKGDIKQNHTHILLYTFNAKSSSAIKKIFDRFSVDLYKNTETEPQNTTSMRCVDMVSQWRYLIHQDNPDKEQYEPCERFCDDIEYWQKLERSAGLNCAVENKGMAIVNAILSGATYRELCERFGNAYILHSPHYNRVAYGIIREEAMQKQNSCTDDIIKLCLDNNEVLTKQDINAFWNVYNYLKADVLIHHQSKFDLIPIKGGD